MTEQGERPKSVVKVVKMPTGEQMLGKLKDAGLFGKTPQFDRLLKAFVESSADDEIVAGGLNMSWEMAMYDTLSNYPPSVQVSAGMYFDRVIDAVTPDPEVAKQAKEFRAQVLEEMKKGK